MTKHLATGWKVMLWNPFLIVLLFIYQLGWGMIIYRFVQSVLVPILHRYPDQEVSASWNTLFYMESQFRLLKTDLAQPYLWSIAVMLLIRMIATPLISAGVYHNVQRTYEDRKKSVIDGIRRFGLAFSFIYWIRMLFTLAPLYWIYPQLSSVMRHGNKLEYILIASFAYILIFFLYSKLLNLLAMYLQFGVVSKQGLALPFRIIAKHFLPALALSFIILVISCLAAAVISSIAIVFAGVIALLLYQAQQLVKSVIQLWEVSCQHDHWVSRIMV